MLHAGPFDPNLGAQGGGHSCRVTRESLTGPLDVLWEEKSREGPVGLSASPHCGEHAWETRIRVLSGLFFSGY